MPPPQHGLRADPSGHPTPPAWLAPSGGLRYHLRALRYHRRHWRAFRATVAGWLAHWQPATRNLVLVGPSAGHTLDAAFLRRFAHILALEPDPLARLWLRQRFRHPGLEFATLDILRQPAHRSALDALTLDAALLFCNVLGQVAPADGWDGLQHWLARRHWASYHDTVSTSRPPDAQGEYASEHPEKLEALVGRFWHGGEIALVDHGTLALHARGLARYTLWPLTPRQHHLIGWVSHTPGEPAP